MDTRAAVFRRSHGLCCFYVIKTARPGAMMVMRQRYNDHFSSSYAPISVDGATRAPTEMRKVGCQGNFVKVLLLRNAELGQTAYHS